MDRKEIIWRAAEYEHMPRDGGWYFLIGGIATVLVLISVWQRNLFFAVFLVIATMMLIYFARRHSPVIEFRITDEGIYVGKTLFLPYDTVESFSVRSRPQHLDEIVVKRTTFFNPYVRLPIDSKTLVQAREVLKKHIAEVECEESLLENISDFFGL